MNHMNQSVLFFRFLVPLLYAVVASGHILYLFQKEEKVAPLWLRGATVALSISHVLFWGSLFLVRSRFPFTTVFEGLIFCSLILSLAYMGFGYGTNRFVYGAFLWPVNFLIVVVSCVFLEKGTPLPRSMISPYFVSHVLFLFGAYACFFLSASISIMYLLQHRQIKQRRLGLFFQRLPSLVEMDLVISRSNGTGLILLVLGGLVGYLWFEGTIEASNRIPIKAAFAALTAVIYALERVFRYGRGWQGTRTCIASLVGFAFVIMTLLVGRHGF